jgi:uncharacterized cupin superfamily protein
VTHKVQIDAAPLLVGSRYPHPYELPCQDRVRRKLGDAAGLTQFGVNLLRLPPGTWSSQRHWHSGEDEFIYVLEGEVVLVCDDGEELLRSGDCAGFVAGERVGHHLQNRSARDALVLELGTRAASPDTGLVDYPDIDMQVRDGRFVHRDGSAYPQPQPTNPEAAPPSPSPATAPSARR